MVKETNLSIDMDRLLNPHANAEEVAIEAGRVQKDMLLLEAKRAVLGCGCRQCKGMAGSAHDELRPTQKTFNPTIIPPSWTQAAVRMKKSSQHS